MKPIDVFLSPSVFLKEDIWLTLIKNRSSVILLEHLFRLTVQVLRYFIYCSQQKIQKTHYSLLRNMTVFGDQKGFA